MGDRGARPRLSQEFVDERKRERCAAIVAELAHEKGLGEVQGGEVITAARVSRTTFYALFPSREGACAYACELARRRLLSALDAAVAGREGWRERVEAVLGGLVLAAAESPREVELCLVHSVVLPGSAPGLHDPTTVEALATIMAGLPGGPEPPPARAELARFTAEAVVSVVATRLRRDEVEQLLEMRGELVQIALNCLLPPGGDGVAAQLRANAA